MRALRAKLSSDQYDVGAWDGAWEELKGLPLTEDTRAVYEEMVGAFPTKVRGARKAVAGGYSAQGRLEWRVRPGCCGRWSTQDSRRVVEDVLGGGTGLCKCTGRP